VQNYNWPGRKIVFWPRNTDWPKVIVWQRNISWPANWQSPSRGLVWG
jgi:hypothetical protein